VRILKFNIDLEGRKLVKIEILEQTSSKIISRTTYDDGTIIKYHQEAENINVECNKTLVVQSDGETVKIV